jgi:hypothetical protein
MDPHTKQYTLTGRKGSPEPQEDKAARRAHVERIALQRQLAMGRVREHWLYER